MGKIESVQRSVNFKKVTRIRAADPDLSLCPKYIIIITNTDSSTLILGEKNKITCQPFMLLSTMYMTLGALRNAPSEFTIHYTSFKKSLAWLRMLRKTFPRPSKKM